jgi:hypothetical protein
VTRPLALLDEFTPTELADLHDGRPKSGAERTRILTELLELSRIHAPGQVGEVEAMLARRSR